MDRSRLSHRWSDWIDCDSEVKSFMRTMLTSVAIVFVALMTPVLIAWTMDLWWPVGFIWAWILFRAIRWVVTD